MLKKELEIENEMLKEEIQKLKNENEKLNNALEIKIETIRDLFIQIQDLTKENNQLKISNAPTPVHKHNERGAGRKNKFTNDMIDFVVNLKNIGYTYLEIKQKFWEKFGKSISVGSITNIVKENS